MTDKEAAYKLYMSGDRQNEIAAVLKISEQSISAWVKAYDWKKKRERNNLFDQHTTEKTQNVISRQLEILDMISEKQRESINEHSSIEELQKALISRGDLDGFQKLFSTIKSKELAWDKIVNLIREFLEFARDYDADAVKALTPVSHSFLDDIRKRVVS